MNESSRIQRRWAWIMGAITLAIALFCPPLRRGIGGFFWRLPELAHTPSPLFELLILVLPLCALTVCTIWLWTLQMNWNPTIIRGILVIFEAEVLALLITAVLFVVILVIPSQGNAWGMAFALFDTMWTGLAFLTFLPCLLIAAIILAYFQRNNQIAGAGIKSGM